MYEGLPDELSYLSVFARKISVTPCMPSGLGSYAPRRSARIAINETFV
jgi:hypothetical protein